MATDSLIISDIGEIYKKLFNHRIPVQNEVNYFVQEFETNRGENDFRILQESMRDANEVDAVFLEEMKEAFPRYQEIKSKLSEVSDQISGMAKDVGGIETIDVSQEERDTMEKEVEDVKKKLAKERAVFESELQKKIDELRLAVEAQRESRSKLLGERTSQST